jgi:hypothetical protein
LTAADAIGICGGPELKLCAFRSCPVRHRRYCCREQRIPKDCGIAHSESRSMPDRCRTIQSVIGEHRWAHSSQARTGLRIIGIPRSQRSRCGVCLRLLPRWPRCSLLCGSHSPPSVGIRWVGSVLKHRPGRRPTPQDLARLPESGARSSSRNRRMAART